MLVDAFLFDGLLGRDIADREQNGGGDALRQKWPRGELALVPASRVSSLSNAFCRPQMNNVINICFKVTSILRTSEA